MFVCMYVCMPFAPDDDVRALLYMCVHTCMYVSALEDDVSFACIHVRVYACMYVCMTACMCVCIFIHTICTETNSWVWVCIYLRGMYEPRTWGPCDTVYACLCICIYIYIHIQNKMLVYRWHARVYKWYAPACIDALCQSIQIHACMHDASIVTCSALNPLLYMHIHTHIHTYSINKMYICKKNVCALTLSAHIQRIFVIFICWCMCVCVHV